MRTSSAKSIASALTLAIALTFVPVADARPTQARSNRGGRNEGIVRLVINFLKRVGQLTTNGGPSIPLGDPEATITPDPLTPATGGNGTSQ
jgi:hypothetical protein